MRCDLVMICSGVSTVTSTSCSAIASRLSCDNTTGQHWDASGGGAKVGRRQTAVGTGVQEVWTIGRTLNEDCARAWRLRP